MQEQQPQQGSRISNFEWGLVTGAALVVDAVQVFLNMFAIGIIANRGIDIVVGMVLPLYFYLRGVKLDSKKVFSWIGSFLLEEIPIVDSLPLWSGDMLLTMALDKTDKKLPTLPI